jgi:probable DNA repair protein
VLENVFQPGDVDHEGDSVAPFNVSLGTRLSEQPVVNDMFLALEWLGGQLVWDKFSELIRSPFLAAAEQELAGRALLDARLRQLGEPVITFEVLEAFLGQDGCADWMAAQCPCLQQMFIDVMAQRDVFAAPNRPQAWLKKIEQLSRLIGWPGQRTPDSQEYQVLAAWQRMLETFAGARVVERALSLRELLSHLRQLAADTVFQGKSPGTPVQVVGLLEAGGMVFDYLWVMDLHDETLPAAPAPNPFLPVALQRRLNMPHASAERELSFARNVIQRLATSGGQVVMSYPLREQDRELTPSPLLSEFPDISIAELDIYPHDYRQSIFQSKALESWRDDQGPALKPQGEVRGGTRLFQYQAACPFLAFATFRLDAEPLANVDVGVDPMTRGIILHAVLEKVWRRLGDRQTLVAMDTEQRIQLVTSCIDDVILPYLDERPVTFSNRFVSLEKRRLANLVLEWLALEEQREAFVVEQTESPQTVTIDSLQVRTKIDRIDKLPDGSRVILDYKTGDASVKDWFGARPDAPQLPLYAVSAEPPPVAVAFASVRTGKCGFTGLSKFSDTLPRVKRFSDSEYCYGDADWSAMLDEWRRSLQGLAQEILQGDARVAPKSGSSCRYCQLQPLCRIDELQTAQKPGPDNDG